MTKPYEHPKFPRVVYHERATHTIPDLDHRIKIESVNLVRSGNGSSWVDIIVSIDGVKLQPVCPFSVDDCTADMIVSGELKLTGDGLVYADEYPAIPILRALRALWALQRAPLPTSAADNPYKSGRSIGRQDGRNEAFETACNALTREQLVEAYTDLQLAYTPADRDLAAYIRALIEV